MENWIFYKKAMKGTHHWKETCYLCNQWVLKDEEFYLIGVPRDMNKHSIPNFIVHKEEWENFIENLTQEEVYQKLLNHKKPRKKPLTKEQLEKVEYFKQACEYYGFNKCVISRDKRFVKMSKKKTSFTLIYDIVFEKMSYDTRAKEGLFGGLFSLDLLAKVTNKFYELAGEDKHCDYSSEKVIQKAMNDVNELMGK